MQGLRTVRAAPESKEDLETSGWRHLMERRGAVGKGWGSSQPVTRIAQHFKKSGVHGGTSGLSR